MPQITVYTALMLLAIPSAAVGQRDWRWATPTRQDGGEGALRVPMVFDFVLRNTGSDTILIDNVRTDCSCTVPEWPAQGVAPGDSLHLKITFDAAHRGAFRKRITVWLAKERRPERLYIRGRIV